MKLKLFTLFLSLSLLSFSSHSGGYVYPSTEKEAIKHKIMEMNKQCQALEAPGERAKCHMHMVGKYNSMMRQMQSGFIKKHAPSPEEIKKQGN